MFELVILCASASGRESVLVAAEGCAKSSVVTSVVGKRLEGSVLFVYVQRAPALFLVSAMRHLRDSLWRGRPTRMTTPHNPTNSPPDQHQVGSAPNSISPPARWYYHLVPQGAGRHLTPLLLCTSATGR